MSADLWKEGRELIDRWDLGSLIRGEEPHDSFERTGEG